MAEILSEKRKKIKKKKKLPYSSITYTTGDPALNIAHFNRDPALNIAHFNRLAGTDGLPSVEIQQAVETNVTSGSSTGNGNASTDGGGSGLAEARGKTITHKNISRQEYITVDESIFTNSLINARDEVLQTTLDNDDIKLIKTFIRTKTGNTALDSVNLQTFYSSKLTAQKKDDKYLPSVSYLNKVFDTDIQTAGYKNIRDNVWYSASYNIVKKYIPLSQDAEVTDISVKSFIYYGTWSFSLPEPVKVARQDLDKDSTDYQSKLDRLKDEAWNVVLKTDITVSSRPHERSASWTDTKVSVANLLSGNGLRNEVVGSKSLLYNIPKEQPIFSLYISFIWFAIYKELLKICSENIYYDLDKTNFIELAETSAENHFYTALYDKPPYPQLRAAYELEKESIKSKDDWNNWLKTKLTSLDVKINNLLNARNDEFNKVLVKLKFNDESQYNNLLNTYKNKIKALKLELRTILNSWALEDMPEDVLAQQLQTKFNNQQQVAENAVTTVKTQVENSKQLTQEEIKNWFRDNVTGLYFIFPKLSDKNPPQAAKKFKPFWTGLFNAVMDKYDPYDKLIEGKDYKFRVAEAGDEYGNRTTGTVEENNPANYLLWTLAGVVKFKHKLSDAPDQIKTILKDLKATTNDKTDAKSKELNETRNWVSSLAIVYFLLDLFNNNFRFYEQDDMGMSDKQSKKESLSAANKLKTKLETKVQDGTFSEDDKKELDKLEAKITQLNNDILSTTQQKERLEDAADNAGGYSEDRYAPQIDKCESKLKELTEAKRDVRRYYIRPMNVFCSNKEDLLKTLVEYNDRNCSVYTLANLDENKDVTKLTTKDIIYYYDNGILYDKNHVKIMDYDLYVKNEERRDLLDTKTATDDQIKKVYDDRIVPSDLDEAFNLDFISVNAYGEILEEETLKESVCCICGETFTYKGFNALPYRDGVCCKECYNKFVIPLIPDSWEE